jgi:molecular chaperone GrpE (heat shock protein)
MTETSDNDSGNTVKDSAVESGTTPASQPFTVTEAEWTAIKALLDKRYTEIATLLRYNKTKDDSIQRLSAEIQKYREGFAFSALKPFINALISLREDCRKSKRDAEKFEPDNEKIKKYIEYLVSDFEEMLTNVGLERGDNSISLNGKPLSGITQPKTPPEAPLTDEQKDIEPSQISLGAEQIKSISDLIECLGKSEAAIRLAIQDKSAADKTIKEYIALAARTDAEHYLALAAPVARQLYKLYDLISAKSQPAGDYSGDALIELYNAVLNNVVRGIEIILTNAGMVIETLDDVFDTQKHKILKTIPSNEEKLDRVIANTYTDCYSYDGKVVYQSKVDVYKFQ